MIVRDFAQKTFIPRLFTFLGDIIETWKVFVLGISIEPMAVTTAPAEEKHAVNSGTEVNLNRGDISDSLALTSIPFQEAIPEPVSEIKCNTFNVYQH